MNRKSSLPRLAAALVACGLAGPACVTEIEGQKSVTLPKEAFRYERFIEAAGYLDADSVTIQVLTAYRKDCGIATTASNHLRRETTDRIELENKDPDSPGDNLQLALRNLHVSARRSIVVVFSDLPLIRNEDPPVLVLVEAQGLVRFKSDGVELHADRIIVRNDEARAFTLDGRPVGSASSGR